MAITNEVEDLFFDFSNRQYWFIRTVGGLYYSDFEEFGFIAISNDGISPLELSNARKNATNSNPAQKIIGELILKRNPKATFQNVHAKALLDFCFVIKKGDVVFIPNENETLRFGIVQDTELSTMARTRDRVPFTFRRKVKWIERKRRRELDAEVWPLFHTQKTVNNANKYSVFINPALNSLYQTESKAHLSLDVTTDQPIDASTFFLFGLDLVEIEKDLNQEFGLSESERVDVKVEVKSPGSIELIAPLVGGLALLGLVTVGLAGGYWKYDLKIGKFRLSTELKTNSLLEKVNNFLNGSAERKKKLLKFQERAQQLEITDKKGNIANAFGIPSESTPEIDTLKKRARKR